MRRRNSRVVMNLPVEMIIGGRSLMAISQDVSPWGMFVRLDPPLGVGTKVDLAIRTDDDQRLLTGATVVHVLGMVAAKALGRQPGIGLVFCENEREPGGYHQFVAGILRLLENRQGTAARADLRIVVADGSTRLLERMSTMLGNAGFAVRTATNGMEALAACMTDPPDVVLAARDLPVIDGFRLLSEMGQRAELAGVPVMIMSDEGSDLARLQAFQLGAMDFIPKPFTSLEIILRARRLVRITKHETERVQMRGVLTHMGLPPLLTMLDHEKKTGVLTVTRGEQIAWITFREGRVVRVRSSEVEGYSRSVLMRVLDWSDGFFELSAGAPDVAEPDLDETVTHLLLEHARISDEVRRSKSPVPQVVMTSTPPTGTRVGRTI